MSFVTLKPRLLVYMVVYLILVYTTLSVFSAGASYRTFGVEYHGSNLDAFTVNESNSTAVVNGAISGGIIGLIVGALVVIAVGVATGGIGVFPAIAIIGASGGAGMGVGAMYGNAVNDDTIDLPYEDVVGIILNFVDIITELILFLLAFLTFQSAVFLIQGVDVPVYLHFIFYLMVLPIQLIIYIWLANLIIDALRSIKPSGILV